MRPKRVGEWRRLSERPEVWEHESSTKLLWVDDGWQVRFPSTTAVPWTLADAANALAVMAGAAAHLHPEKAALVRGCAENLARAVSPPAEAVRVDNEEIRRLAGVPVTE